MEEENKSNPELLYVVRTSKLNFVESVLCAAFFAGACAYVLGPLLEYLTFVQPYMLKIRVCMGAVFTCVFLAILSPFLSYGICQKLYVYDDRLLYRSGFFRRDTQSLPLTRVTGVETSESLWQRAIGTGDIMVMSGSLPRIVFRGVRNPDQTVAYLQKAANIF